jgi:hypothetical protein
VGNIGSYSGSFLKIQSAGNQSGTLYGTTAHYPLKNDALSDADIDLGGTSNRFKDAYLSGGVYLGGVGSSNLLDDYEEGTWTPTWTSSGTNPTVSYNAQIGKYTKVGNKVFAWGGISANPTGAGTGSIFLNGLPFNPNTSAEIAGGQVGLCDHFDSGYTPLVIHADNNNSYCWLYYSTSHGGYTNNSVPANALRNGTLYFSVSYAVY